MRAMKMSGGTVLCALVLALAGCGGEAEAATVTPEPQATTGTVSSAATEPLPLAGEGRGGGAEGASAATEPPLPLAEEGGGATGTLAAGASPGVAADPPPQPSPAGGGGSAGASAGGTVAEAPAPLVPPPPDPAVLRDAIRQVVRMPSDRALARAARARRMRIQNLSWEDTGRYMGSSVGPNISDLTLEVMERTTTARGRERTRTHLLPVLRYPNFTDRTADVPADRFWVRVGNQRPGAQPGDLTPVPLTEVLTHLRTYLSDGTSLRGEIEDLTARRDTHYLVSAQHVFVPVPDGVTVEWAPVLFNYQSNPGEPAVLCLVITREGTSITIIENRPDPLHPDGWGQRLYFNHGGQRTLFTAERRSDVAQRIEAGQARPEDATALEEGADMVMIVQVPLRLTYRPRRSASMGGGGGGVNDLLEGAMSAPSAGGGFGAGRSGGAVSDVERAVVGHGLEEGPFHEIRNRRIRRDPRFPIRVTVQFYRATSNGVVSEADLNAAVSTIERVYAEADFVGSLVVGSQERPTSWVSPSPTPAPVP